MVFLIDASKDCTKIILEHEKTFVRTQARYIRGKPRSQTAAAMYAGDAATLASFVDNEKFDKLVDGAELDITVKNFAKAFKHAEGIFSESMYTDNEKMLVVLMVGAPDDSYKAKLRQGAKPLWEKKIRIVVVVIRPGNNNNDNNNNNNNNKMKLATPWRLVQVILHPKVPHYHHNNNNNLLLLLLTSV